MKLLYDLPPSSRSAIEYQMKSGEKIMYCLPYNIEGNKFVSDGFTVITNQFIYKFLIRFCLNYFLQYSLIISKQELAALQLVERGQKGQNN